MFRRLADSLPATLTTQIQLSVAGEGREIRLPQVLPQGFIPISVDGPLAARLDPDNTLRVQVRPGEFELTIEARGPSPATEVHLGALPAPWPADEIWSFQAQDRLRVVTVDGVAALDPVQANVPSDWRELPAYRMNPGTVLRLTERSRGMSVADANQLQLLRTMWLDFSGAGYTVVDRIRGRMRQGWRLEMSPPYALQSARTAAENSLLVTSGVGPGFSGVEVRDQDLDLTTVARLPRSDGALLATGWHERLSHVRGTLIVGPGYRLLAAPGTDAAPQAWLERWQLLDIFAVLLIATVAWRVLGLRLAALAIAALALTYQESGAPIWLWLNVLIALALLRAAPRGAIVAVGRRLSPDRPRAAAAGARAVRDHPGAACRLPAAGSLPGVRVPGAACCTTGDANGAEPRTPAAERPHRQHPRQARGSSAVRRLSAPRASRKFR